MTGPLISDASSRPTLRGIAQGLSGSRRDFLRSSAGMVLGGALAGASPFLYAGSVKKRKMIVVTFGGGARDQETFAPQGQDNIPHLLKELIPQASFFTQVVNHGILGHYVATASLATGVYETLNNFASFRHSILRSSNIFGRISSGRRRMPGLLHQATGLATSAKAIRGRTDRAGARKLFFQNIC